MHHRTFHQSVVVMLLVALFLSACGKERSETEGSESKITQDDPADPGYWEQYADVTSGGKTPLAPIGEYGTGSGSDSYDVEDLEALFQLADEDLFSLKSALQDTAQYLKSSAGWDPDAGALASMLLSFARRDAEAFTAKSFLVGTLLKALTIKSCIRSVLAERKKAKSSQSSHGAKPNQKKPSIGSCFRKTMQSLASKIPLIVKFIDGSGIGMLLQQVLKR